MRSALILTISIAVGYGLFVVTENAIVLFWRNPTLCLYGNQVLLR